MTQTPQTDGEIMSNLYWLSEDQMARLRAAFPKSHGVPRVDDRRVLSGNISIDRNRLILCDAPKEYGTPKTLYNRWKRWSDMGVFARIMMGLAAEVPDKKTFSIDATSFKVHRTRSNDLRPAGTSLPTLSAAEIQVRQWLPPEASSPRFCVHPE